MSNQNAVDVNDAVKTFHVGFWRKRVEAVRGVSFSVPVNQSVGLVGPNGAGKTTTLKMLLGLVYPTAGSLSLFGLKPGTPAANARLGYMPENPYLYKYLKPLEFLDLCARTQGLSADVRKARCDHWLERVGLGHAADRPIMRFSKGMMQRVGLAQAMLHEPDLIVLDEPMSGLDPVGRMEVRELLLEQKRRGATLLVTSHILHDVEMLCDSIVMITQGSVAATGTLSELCQDSGRVEVVVNKLHEDLAYFAEMHQLEVDRRGERVALHCGSWEQARRAIEAAEKAKVTVLSATLERENLESLFMRTAARQPE